MAAVDNSRTVFVFAHLGSTFVPAGRLLLVERDTQLLASTFTYGRRYLDRANALEIDPVALSLHDRDAVRDRPLLPANGLPFFGGIRDAAPDAWGRRVIEARLRVPANSLAESTYLLEAGSERTGALDVRTALDAAERRVSGTTLPLEYLLEAAARIEEGQEVPASLSAIFDAGSSLGGMRPKASLRDADGVLWLAKFPSAGDRQLDVPMIEYATLRLAKLAGLAVPDLRCENAAGHSVLCVRRFDRVRDAVSGSELRLHMVSALTLLACTEQESPTKSYMDIADALRRYGSTQTLRADLAELYARMVFNILVSNDDDHLRNHAFLRTADGWGLSPLYDVMPRPSVAGERYQHLGVGPQGRLATLDNAFAARERFTLLPDDALTIIDRIWRVLLQWRTHCESFGMPAAQIERIAPAFRSIDAVASEELRRRL